MPDEVKKYISRYTGTQYDEAVEKVLNNEIQGTPGPAGPAGPQGLPGEKGEKGDPGKDATINGQNTIEIAAGENVQIDQLEGKMTISATGGGSEGDSLIKVHGPSESVSVNIDDAGTVLQPISEIKLVQEGEGTPSLTNIRNITEWNNITITHNSDMKSQELPESVYGGTYDWANGVLTITHKIFNFAVANMNNYENHPGWRNKFELLECFNVDEDKGFIPDACNFLKNKTVGIKTKDNMSVLFILIGDIPLTQSEWKEQYPDLVCQFVFPLIKPRKIKLTPHEFTALVGLNTFTSDCGNTSVKVVNSKLAEYVDAELDSLTFSDGLPIGGTAGQILAKKTAEDYDTYWIDAPTLGSTTGVTTFNGRSGAVTPQNGDYTAEMVGALSNTVSIPATAEDIGAVPNTRKVNGKSLNSDITLSAQEIPYSKEGSSATNVSEAIQQLFTSVSDGKSLIASAITDKGVETESDATFETIKENILAIPSSSMPEGTHIISLTADPHDGGNVFGGGVASDGMTITVKAETAYGYKFGGWQENGSEVSDLAEYAFQVTENRSLEALFTENPIAPIWVETTLSSISTWASITYGNGIFVTLATGSDSRKVAYSTDGVTWDEKTLPFSANWVGVTYGNGKFIAVANNSSKSAYSTDGIIWKSATLPSSTYWRSAVYGNGKFVMVTTDGGKAAYSIDGINWTEITLPSSAGWYSVTYGDGKFVTVANNSRKVAYSTDGVTWKSAMLPSSAYWRSVTYGDGKFVAVANNSNKSAYSIDGINWTEITLPSSAGWYSVTYGDGKFVTVANNSNKSAYSIDGINWTEITLPSSAYWQSVTYGDRKFVVVATNGGKAAYTI